jgi:uncharacterized membrane protein YeaQ/YmgE (transglycosylase-associated protein family)
MRGASDAEVNGRIRAKRQIPFSTAYSSAISEIPPSPYGKRLPIREMMRVGPAGEAGCTVKFRGGFTMSFIAWIILGLIAGFVGSKLVNRQGEGLFMDIILGVVGAMLGGWLFTRFGAQGVTGLNLYSIFVAVIGAVVFLVAYHAIRRAV